MRNLSPQLLKFLKSLGIEFWLPLPLLGLSFWFVGGLLTDTLSHSRNNDVVNLQATQPDYSYGIASIKVEIYPTKGFSLVTVKKAINKRRTTYTKSEIILNTTDILSVEAEISNQLGISREKVRKMMRYR